VAIHLDAALRSAVATHSAVAIHPAETILLVVFVFLK